MRLILALILTMVLGGTKSQVLINEFLASNTACNYDPDKTQYVDWIELHNFGSSALNIGGYFLSDDSLDIQKWEIPSNTIISPYGYLLFWADGLDFGDHTNFKLSRDGEFIGFYSPEGQLIDNIAFGPQRTDISYGRDPGKSAEWGYFFYPTAGTANTTTFYQQVVKSPVPVFSITGGFYSGTQVVELSADTTNNIIRYTLNGSDPDTASSVFDGPITVANTVTIRARCFVPGVMPSDVITNTYFINVSHSLPVISLSSDTVNFFGDTIGIYCVGTNGIEGYGGIVANYWHKDWERPVNVELFETNGEQVINQVAEIAINGARRNMAQKSLRLFARSKFGSPTFDYPIFQDCDVSSFPSLILRNGGLPDFSNSLIRDNLTQKLISSVADIDNQAGRKAVVYINGEYWGIYSIKEKQNEKYLASHHKIDPDNIDYLENENADIIEGDNDDYNQLKNLLSENNTNNYYDYINKNIDIEEYLNYLTTEIYAGNYDWPMINIKFWREKSEFGKWRWVLFDTDVCFGLWGDYNYNSIHHALNSDSCGWPNPPSSTEFIRLILSNTNIKNRFIQTFAAHAATTFNAQRVIGIAEEMKNELAPEMPLHIQRWKDYDSPDGACVQSIDEWEQAIDIIEEYAENRWQSIKQYVIDEFNLGGVFPLTTQAEHGTILIYSVPIGQGEQTNEFFSNIPIKFRAVPEPGYLFVKWEGASQSENSKITLNLSGTSTLTAIFAQDDRTVLPASITDDDTLYYALSPYIGLTNTVIEPEAKLFVEPGVKIYMPEKGSIIIKGALNAGGTEDMPVCVAPNEEAEQKSWGVLVFDNCTDTSYLNNLILQNTTAGPDKNIHKAAITSLNSDLICDNISISACYFPVYAKYGSCIIRNSNFYCRYTCDMINIKYAGTAIIENCNIKGNGAPDTDGIDFDGITNGMIKDNIIYGFTGFNSDGIDIGENSDSILILNNRIFNCFDKGVSVGQGSSVIIKNNIIYNCDMAVGVKDSSSYALVDKNTLYNNGYGISCYQKKYNAGGGEALIKNTIISGSRILPVWSDNHSLTSVSYSCSDTEPLSGNSNILADPLFNDVVMMNLGLQPASLCIDAGDPASPLDDDGTITDIGAIFVFTAEPDTNIVINEINYHSASNNNSGDWVELHNKSYAAVDISGWTFCDEKKDHIYIIPDGLIVGAKNYIVLSNGTDQFRNIYPVITNIRGNIGFNFSNSGELLRLYDSKMNLTDIVEYSDSEPWPEEADGDGYTLELINPYLDNSLPASWVADTYLGTPGITNGYDLSAKENHIQSAILYPNPADLFFSIKGAHNATVKIFNMQGVCVKEIYNYNTSVISLQNLTSGFYFVLVHSENVHTTLKLIIK